MHESVPSRAPIDEPSMGPLPIREMLLLTACMALVGAVGYGLGYVSGRDQAAFVQSPPMEGELDRAAASQQLIELLARIEVSDASDKGLGELRFPDELRGRPQDRPPPQDVVEDGPAPRFAIDLGPTARERIEDLQVVLQGRGIHAEVLEDGSDRPRLLVGAYTDPVDAASWLPLLEEGVLGLGLGRPAVVPDPRTALGEQ